MTTFYCPSCHRADDIPEAEHDGHLGHGLYIHPLCGAHSKLIPMLPLAREKEKNNAKLTDRNSRS